jgi:integrase
MEAGLLRRRPLSEKMWILTSTPLRTGAPDGQDEPAASANDRRHDGSQPLAGDTAILHLRGQKIQRVFQQIAGQARDRGRSHLSASPDRAAAILVAHQPGVVALRFFFGVTLGRSEAIERIVAGREPQTLPAVLSGDEIVRFLEAVPGLRNRAALTTAYGAGLRVGEVARLKVASIDSARMLIRIERGKGGKERYVMLSAQLLQILRAYWRLARPGLWLFPGRAADEPVSVAALQDACRRGARLAQLGKPVTVHTLRHNSGNRIIPATDVQRMYFLENRGVVGTRLAE